MKIEGAGFVPDGFDPITEGFKICPLCGWGVRATDSSGNIINEAVDSHANDCPLSKRRLAAPEQETTP